MSGAGEGLRLPLKPLGPSAPAERPLSEAPRRLAALASLPNVSPDLAGRRARQAEPLRLGQQVPDGGGVPPRAAARRALPHGFQLGGDLLLSIPVESSSKAPIGNSSVHFDLITSIAAWWFKAGEVVEIEIDDGLQSFACRGVAQPVRQGLGPCGIVGL